MIYRLERKTGDDRYEVVSTYTTYKRAEDKARELREKNPSDEFYISYRL